MKLLSFLLLPTLLLSTPLQTRTQALMGTFVHINLEEQYNRQISQSFFLVTMLHIVTHIKTQTKKELYNH